MLEYQRRNGCQLSRLALRRNPGRTSQPATDLSHTEKFGDLTTEDMTEPENVDDRKHVDRAHVAASNGRTKQQPQAVYKQKSGYA